MGFGAEDALDFVESGRRRLVGDDGAAAEHEQGRAHSPVASARPEVERGGAATAASGGDDSGSDDEQHRRWGKLAKGFDVHGR